MRLIIVGLRRSGTTVFWESFRSDPRLVCYDEPFNPLLRELPLPEPKGTRDEFIALHGRDPQRFWERFSPIDRIGELQESLSDRQRGYLDSLLDGVEHAVLDTTRCHYKLGALHIALPDACVVHLLRPAAAWVSSHLGPGGRGLRGRLRARRDRSSFFERSDRFNYWGIEEVVGASPGSLFGLRLAEAGLDPEAVYRLPAVGKMLAYWKVHRDRVEADGRRHFGERFTTVRFPEFCERPADTLRRIYALAGLSAPEFAGFAHVHPPRGAYRPDDPRWRSLAEQVGLDPANDLF